MAKNKEPKVKKERFKTLKQIGQTYSITRKSDRALPWVILGTLIGTALPLVLVAQLLFDSTFSKLITTSLAISTSLLATVYVFGKRAEKAAYARIEGQPGAAAAVLNTLRKGWFVTPAVAVTRNQDLVHRVIGPVGIVLVGEGSPSRVAQLLESEKIKAKRIAGDIPVASLIVGNGEGLITFKKLNKTIMKMGKKISPAESRELRNRFGASGASALPIPKGAMPKGMRIPRR
ncbi:unannotated protein [freshwater metagenome]|uniref:Unannotated protein n=1 Tax=freshwater metagenome TaxID=449393 RepID=A0A6J6E0G0_9ZZZZ|nr:DUF4191 family protein [Actinomycetota bacterium]